MSILIMGFIVQDVSQRVGSLKRKEEGGSKTFPSQRWGTDVGWCLETGVAPRTAQGWGGRVKVGGWQLLLLLQKGDSARSDWECGEQEKAGVMFGKQSKGLICCHTTSPDNELAEAADGGVNPVWVVNY
uniref:Uncharacterized protein n=1 Tax=Sphaerodactylus townsendi TaxID=933632 RepID=A0ACB8GES0_9SAUR